MQREIDLRETAKALAADQALFDAQKILVDQLNVRLIAAEQALDQKRAEILAASQTLASAQTEQRNATRAADEAGARVHKMAGELALLGLARDQAEERFLRAQAGLAEADGRAAAQRENISRFETRLTEVRTERDVRRDTLAQARLELAERRQKVEVLDRGLADMERRRGQIAGNPRAEAGGDRRLGRGDRPPGRRNGRPIGKRRPPGGDAGNLAAAGGGNPRRTGRRRAGHRRRSGTALLAAAPAAADSSQGELGGHEAARRKTSGPRPVPTAEDVAREFGQLRHRDARLAATPLAG